jgi:hypothetical protein
MAGDRALGESNKKNRMQRFAKTYGRAYAVLHDHDASPWLEVNEPAILASFLTFCKVPLGAEGVSVYLRGQTERHPTLLPSLFRGAANDAVRRKRWSAYQCLLRGLPEKVRGTRFTKPNFGAVLQHYGLRTPWLDVLDDMHAAIWFALNTRHQSGGMLEYSRTVTDFGWIVVLAEPNGCRVVNLRAEQSSRNTRCHVQQGFSLATQSDDEEKPGQDQDFAGAIVGTVRIPNSERWQLRGFRASQPYFFPPMQIDNTYGQLLSPDVTALVERVEHEHMLAPETLGRVARYKEEKV